MPAKKSNGPTTVAEIDAALPRCFFVRRGDVRAAFGLSNEEMSVLTADIFSVIYLAPNKARGRQRSRALFVRSQVLAVARRWFAQSLPRDEALPPPPPAAPAKST